jgi:hypothetical protein
MLSGRQNEISEYQIGIQVFDRPKGYRTVEDNIVRNYARQLRKRLSEYFADDGQFEMHCIEIPLGGYVPVFAGNAKYQKSEDLSQSVSLHNRLQEANSEPPALVRGESAGEIREATASAWWRRRWTRVFLIVAYSVALVGVTAFVSTRIHIGDSGEHSANLLWTSMFRSPLDTFIVPADCGFNILEDLSKRQVPLAGYLKGDYLGLPLPAMDQHTQVDLRTQEFTSFVDLQIVSAISHLTEVDPRRVFLRFPRDLRMDDLKTGNVVLIGSIGSNPWASIVQRDLNFRIEYNREMQQAWVVNTHPQRGEADRYESKWDETAHPTYAVISYQPNLSGNGHMLLIQGLDVAGTQAAAEALLRGDQLAPVLQAATRSNSELRPFEVLLQSTSIESNAANTRVIAFRTA